MLCELLLYLCNFCIVRIDISFVQYFFVTLTLIVHISFCLLGKKMTRLEQFHLARNTTSLLDMNTCSKLKRTEIKRELKTCVIVKEKVQQFLCHSIKKDGSQKFRNSKLSCLSAKVKKNFIFIVFLYFLVFISSKKGNYLNNF